MEIWEGRKGGEIGKPNCSGTVFGPRLGTGVRVGDLGGLNKEGELF